MTELLHVPVVRRGALMPDTCPAGQGIATIPVGGAIEVENVILPGGAPDLSESPLGYKDATKVKAQIEQFQLATVVGEIRPLGCIMAGEAPEPPWAKRRREKRAAHKAVRREWTAHNEESL